MAPGGSGPRGHIGPDADVEPVRSQGWRRSFGLVPILVRTPPVDVRHRPPVGALPVVGDDLLAAVDRGLIPPPVALRPRIQHRRLVPLHRLDGHLVVLHLAVGRRTGRRQRRGDGAGQAETCERGAGLRRQRAPGNTGRRSARIDRHARQDLLGRAVAPDAAVIEVDPREQHAGGAARVQRDIDARLLAGQQRRGEGHAVLVGQVAIVVAGRCRVRLAVRLSVDQRAQHGAVGRQDVEGAVVGGQRGIGSIGCVTPIHRLLDPHLVVFDLAVRCATCRPQPGLGAAAEAGEGRAGGERRGARDREGETVDHAGSTHSVDDDLLA